MKVFQLKKIIIPLFYTFFFWVQQVTKKALSC